MFQTCLLTFTIYVESAIYTAEIPSISSQFHVSNVARQWAPHSLLPVTDLVSKSTSLSVLFWCHSKNVVRSYGLDSLEQGTPDW